MTEEHASFLRRCRKGLIEHARGYRAAGRYTPADWEDEAMKSEAGQAVGSREVDAIVHVVWGIGGSPLR